MFSAASTQSYIETFLQIQNWHLIEENVRCFTITPLEFFKR